MSALRHGPRLSNKLLTFAALKKTTNILPLNFWGITDAGKPLLIAGPCSAESELQVRETARQLVELQVHIFRAGIWKPRTRPDSFEGVGKKGLGWLKKVKHETGMLVATEVANRQHVLQALDAGIDVLWIGARSTANPFTVQEIADALENSGVMVLVKNPVNPEINLWIGAIERLNQAGITKIAAVHRGFSTYEKTEYRNKPIWQIPIDLMQQMPNIPVISDPSHICGNRNIINVLQNAIDLNYAGFMIEVHHDPDHALSDAQQQITPDELQKILLSLQNKKLKTDNQEFIHLLQSLRQKIDNLDDQLMEVLKERMLIAENIGTLKTANSITILQPDRWQEILDRARKTALDINLNPDFIEKVFSAIHEESINRQKLKMNDGINVSELKTGQP
mgnify:CR=1 FL=1